MRVITVLALQVMGVAAAYGATRIGTFFVPTGSAPSNELPGVATPAARAPGGGVASNSGNSPLANQGRASQLAWEAPNEAALADPWPPPEAVSWDAMPALEIVEPWQHQEVSQALALVEPWPGGAAEALNSAPLATQSRGVTLVVDPWLGSAPTVPPLASPIPKRSSAIPAQVSPIPTKAFPLLPDAR